MSEQRQKVVEEKDGRAEESRVKIGVHGSSVSGGELKEIEEFLHVAESSQRVRPSLERWARFNERVMQRILASRRCRPLSREWRRRLLDRLRASDSRLKETWWIAVALIVLAFVFALGYLAR